MKSKPARVKSCRNAKAPLRSPHAFRVGMARCHDSDGPGSPHGASITLALARGLVSRRLSCCRTPWGSPLELRSLLICHRPLAVRTWATHDRTVMGERGASWHASHRQGRGRGDQKSDEKHHSKGSADHGDLLLVTLWSACEDRARALDSGFWALANTIRGGSGTMPAWRTGGSPEPPEPHRRR